MSCAQRGVAFPCHGDWLYGVLNLPEASAPRGVLFVVGGPQYRVGSHRQFVLLARHLGDHGIPSLRFDYRGMGDSDGMARTFESIEDDVAAAVDHFFCQVPGLREIVLWGLCDGASAASFYAAKDHRVTGLILLNPWMRTEQQAARTYLRHYYARRLFEAEFWSKVLRGRFDYRSAALAACKLAGACLSTRHQVERSDAADLPALAAPLPDRMLQGLTDFRGRTLFIISGNDLTAHEFLDITKASRPWRRLLAGDRVERRYLAEANHTFAQRGWRDQVAEWTRQWVQSW